MLSGTHLVLSYKTQKWNVYVAGILLKIKYVNNETAYENDKTSSIVSKRKAKGDISRTSIDNLKYLIIGCVFGVL